MDKEHNNKIVKRGKESIKLGALIGLLLGGSMTYRGLVTAATTPQGSFSFVLIVIVGSFIGLVIGVIVGKLVD